MERNSESQKFGLPGIGIPSEILLNPYLSNNEKIIYGFIRNLASNGTGCFASNKWIGNYLQLSPQSISNSISKLKEQNCIFINNKTNLNGSETRYIFINPNYFLEFQQRVWNGEFEGYPLLKNLYPPINNFIPPYPIIINNNSLLEEGILTSSSDLQKNNTSKLLNNGVSLSYFDKFWDIYPKKSDKGRALTAWKTLCRKPNNQRPSWETIKEAIEAQMETPRWANKTFIPMACTWINQSRWLDDPKEMIVFTRKSNSVGNKNFNNEKVQYRDYDNIIKN